MIKKQFKDQKTTIKCPRCKETCEYSENNKFRPFCSKPCKDADFIKWSDEQYKIPVPEDESEGESSDLGDKNKNVL